MGSLFGSFMKAASIKNNNSIDVFLLYLSQQ